MKQSRIVNSILVVSIFYLGQNVIFHTTSQAATVKLDASGNASHILGLDVSGTLYNVEFQLGALDFTFARSSLALDAATQIANALNALTPIATAVTDGTNTRTEYFVFSDIVILSPGPGLPALSTELYGGTYPGDQNAWQTFFTSRATTSSLLMAHFSPVPIPSAYWLFSAGLVGLIGMARRKSGLAPVVPDNRNQRLS